MNHRGTETQRKKGKFTSKTQRARRNIYCASRARIHFMCSLCLRAFVVSSSFFSVPLCLCGEIQGLGSASPRAWALRGGRQSRRNVLDSRRRTAGRAGVAEPVDATDLKSVSREREWGFESPRPHQSPPRHGSGQNLLSATFRGEKSGARDLGLATGEAASVSGRVSTPAVHVLAGSSWGPASAPGKRGKIVYCHRSPLQNANQETNRLRQPKVLLFSARWKCYAASPGWYCILGL